MPIAHIHLTKQPLYIPRLEVPGLNDMAEFALRLTDRPDCKVDIGEAGQLADITPPYWGDERQATYILAMKRTSEAARLHIIPQDPDRPTQSISPDGRRVIGQGRVINIPAQEDGVGLLRPARRGQYLAGAVIYLTPDNYRALRTDFDRINLRNNAS